MSQGCIYIFSNPSLIGNPLKIGKTTRTPEERAKELSGTGLPDGFIVEYYEDVFNCDLAEKLIHEKLAKYRHNKNREFFKLPLQEAISKVQEVTQQEIYQKIKINKSTHVLNENMIFRWTCNHGDYVFLFRYEDLSSLMSDEIDFDVWECIKGDQLIIDSKHYDDFNDLDIHEDFVDVALNILEEDKSIHGLLSEIIDIYPGDRLLWVGKNNKNNSNTFTNNFSSVIIDCLEYAKVIVSSREIPTTKEGYPLPFGSLLNEIPQEVMQQAYLKIKELGIPNTWASPTMDLP